MYSLREGLPAPPAFLPPRDPTLAMARPPVALPPKDPTIGKPKSPFSSGTTTTRPPIVLPPKDPTIGLDLVRKCEKQNSLFSSLTRPPIVLPPKDPTIGLDLVEKREKQKAPFSSVTCPPTVLPPKDPTIGLDLVEKRDKPKEEFKMLFLPQKIDIDKINEYYRNEDLKIMNRNKEKSQARPRQLNSLCPPPNPNKGCRKALFKPSRHSIRKSFRGSRTSILGRKSTKNPKTVNESLLDSSLVEKKIFDSKSRGTFKFKSPRAVQKNIPKPTVKALKKTETPKNLDKKPAPTTSSKRTNASAEENKISCKESIANHLKEIRNLLALDKEEFEAFKKAHDDRFIEIKNLLQKIECVSCKCEKGGNSDPTKTRNDDNHTPKRSAARVETLRVSTLKRTVQFDVDVKALNFYNSLNKSCYMALSTPKITREGVVAESPAASEDPKKIISRKIQEQCLMLQTPMKK